MSESDDAVSMTREELAGEVERLDNLVVRALERINDLEDVVVELKTENQKLRAKLPDTENKKGSKKTRAKIYSANIILSQAGKQKAAGFSGAAVTATQVKNGAESNGERLAHRTIYDAWHDLAERWPFLRVRDGDGRKKDGKTKALLADDVDALPSAFRDTYSER